LLQVPVSLRPNAAAAFDRAVELRDAGAPAAGEEEAPVNYKEIKENVAVLSKMMQKAARVASGALPGFAGAVAASPARSGRAPAPMSDATGRMLVEAIRAGVEVFAAAVCAAHPPRMLCAG
jgi:hypothetical protein